MAEIRVDKPSSDFAMVPRYIPQSRGKYSLGAVGLFTLLASFPQGTKTSIPRLAGHVRNGKAAILSYKAELEKGGALLVEQERGPGSRFSQSVWRLVACPGSPRPQSDIQTTEIPCADSPDTAARDAVDRTTCKEYLCKENKTEDLPTGRSNTAGIGGLILGAIARLQGEGEPDGLADRIVAFTGDSEPWRSWWATVAECLEASAAGRDFVEGKLSEAASLARQGELNAPGRWLCREVLAWCRTRRIMVPDLPTRQGHPATRADAAHSRKHAAKPMRQSNRSGPR
jgi:hypothetical protein